MRRHREVVIHRSAQLGRDVLHQRAAAGHVQDLNATADGEDRQVTLSGFGDERDLEGVARRIDFGDGRLRRLAVALGRHVFAAAQQQAVDAGQGVDDVMDGSSNRTSPLTWMTACR